MNKEIRYRGLANNPSDYEATEGDFAFMRNFINENGTLQPLGIPKLLRRLDPGERVFLVHAVPNGVKNLISIHGDHLCWRNETTPLGKCNNPKVSLQGVKQVVAMGNMLVITAPFALFYAVWKDNAYHLLGEMPELPELQFGLNGVMSVSEKVQPYEVKLYVRNIPKHKSENRAAVQTLLAHANKMIADHKDWFIFPFFVRFAFRLFDGTYTKHSAPVLLLPSTFHNPIFQITNLTESGLPIISDAVPLEVAACIALSSLSFRNYSDNSGLASWKDFISGIDVFISAPIYSYSQDPTDEEIEDYVYEVNSLLYGLSNKLSNFPTSSFDFKLGERNALHMFSDGTKDFYVLPNIQKKRKNFLREISNAANFYHFASFTLDEVLSWPIYDGKASIAVHSEVEDIRNVINRQRLTDDINSHIHTDAGSSFIYNNRLHLGNITKRPFSGFSLKESLHGTPHVGNVFRYVVYTKKGGSAMRTERRNVSVPSMPFDLRFIYVPDPDAYRLVVISQLDSSVRYDLPLKRHEYLNGAYWFDELKGAKEAKGVSDAGASPDIAYKSPNQILISEATNPFFFPPGSAVTVGTGEIITLSSATKALSQGQFGQFPLYAFTTEGIWSLSVSDKGTYSARQPVTRDVCLSARCVSQIDNAVVFASARGVMVLEGSQTSCVSDSLNGTSFLPADRLPHFASLSAYLPKGASTADVPFLEYLHSCSMAFDYVNQRVWLYNAKFDYAYIFSLKTKLWSVACEQISHAVAAYPHALVVAKRPGEVQGLDDCLVNLSEVGDTSAPVTCMAVTRPFSLGDPNALKTVYELVQRGYFRQPHVSVVLWASRNLQDWMLVGSSVNHFLRGIAGTPYKFFRLAVVSNTIMVKEAVSGCSIDFGVKENNRLR